MQFLSSSYLQPLQTHPPPHVHNGCTLMNLTSFWAPPFLSKILYSLCPQTQTLNHAQNCTFLVGQKVDVWFDCRIMVWRIIIFILIYLYTFVYLSIRLSWYIYIHVSIYYVSCLSVYLFILKSTAQNCTLAIGSKYFKTIYSNYKNFNIL